MPEWINAAKISGRPLQKRRSLGDDTDAQLGPPGSKQGAVEVLQPAHGRGFGDPFRQLFIRGERDRLPLREPCFAKLASRLKEPPRNSPPEHQVRRQFLAHFLRREH
jgi:hypothetical protein